jgi:hypothetical protein
MIAKMKQKAGESLIDATRTMHARGTPLMRLVLPPDDEPEQWAHYPPDDAISPVSGCRYFYHCHPPEERRMREHGHFHLFLPLGVFALNGCKSAPPDDGQKRAEVVHLGALSVDMQGVPLSLFSTNRWVTDEWLYPADDIAAVIDQFDLTGADGNPLVNQWLTAFVTLAREPILALLHERDAALSAKGWPGEDRSSEIMASSAIDLQGLIE